MLVRTRAAFISSNVFLSPMSSMPVMYIVVLRNRRHLLTKAKVDGIEGLGVRAQYSLQIELAGAVGALGREPATVMGQSLGPRIRGGGGCLPGRFGALFAQHALEISGE